MCGQTERPILSKDIRSCSWQNGQGGDLRQQLIVIATRRLSAAEHLALAIKLHNKEEAMSIIRFGRLFLVGVVALLAVAIRTTLPAVAAGLNPPPPGPARCQTTGQGTVCQGSKPLAYTDPNGLLGLTCNGAAIIETGNGVLSYMVFYNQDGNATRAILHADQNARQGNTLTSSATGKSVPFNEHFTEHFEFTTPGDLDTATEQFTGLFYNVTVPGSGVVLHDVGRVSFDLFPHMTSMQGPHDVFAALLGQSGALNQFCTALS
jgi:hypothetical protein